jgi:hypothetical protein
MITLLRSAAALAVCAALAPAFLNRPESSAPPPRMALVSRRVARSLSIAPQRAARSAAPSGRRVATGNATVPNSTPPPFILGVWYQPISSFTKWKQRGVNTLVGYETEGGRVSSGAWTSAAAAAGLYMVREPGPSASDDAAQPYLIAWLQHDEPDIRTPPVSAGSLASNYAAWRKTRALPVFLNVSGSSVLFNKLPASAYSAYFHGGSDWVSSDFYPVCGYDKPQWIEEIGHIAQMLSDLSGGKPVFSFIESSDQKLSYAPRGTRGVNRDQFRAELWDAVIHGVRGVIYFPQQIGGFQYDTTPAAVVSEMTVQDNHLADLAAVLNTRANPSHLKVSVSAPLEAGWRLGPDGRPYVFVLNMSASAAPAQAIHITRAGAAAYTAMFESGRQLQGDAHSTITDDFGPYGVHVYVGN